MGEPADRGDRAEREEPLACAEDGCERPAVVELHVPWDENRLVCAPHARVLGRQDGVVADPLPDSADHLLERE